MTQDRDTCKEAARQARLDALGSFIGIAALFLLPVFFHNADPAMLEKGAVDNVNKAVVKKARTDSVPAINIPAMKSLQSRVR